METTSREKEFPIPAPSLFPSSPLFSSRLPVYAVVCATRLERRGMGGSQQGQHQGRGAKRCRERTWQTAAGRADRHTHVVPDLGKGKPPDGSRAKPGEGISCPPFPSPTVRGRSCDSDRRGLLVSHHLSSFTSHPHKKRKWIRA